MSRIIKVFEGFKEDYIRDLEIARQQVINVKESYKSKVESYLEGLKIVYDFGKVTISDPPISKKNTDELYFKWYFRSNIIEGENVKNHLLKRYKIVNMANDIIDVGDRIESELGLIVKYKCDLYYTYNISGGVENYKSHTLNLGWFMSKEEFKKESKTYSQPWTNKGVIYKVMKVQLEITE